MPPTKKKQKNRDGKKRRAPKPVAAPTPSPSPLQAFFANYAPRFRYNPAVSASWEFYRLCNESGWEKTDPQRVTAHQKFKDAIVQQFNSVYGTDVDSLDAWQCLCRVVRINPIPDDLHACREGVYYTFVNLIDLVDTWTTHKAVDVFPSESALSEYTIETGKYFPRDNVHAGGLLQYLLRHILHPRKGYDDSRRWGKFGRSKRR